MTQDELLNHVTEAYKEVNGAGPVEPITPATKFEDLNLDSLEVVELALHLEDRVGVKLPGDVVDEAKTVGELIAPLTMFPKD